jgi:hypothetical protein
MIKRLVFFVISSAVLCGLVYYGGALLNDKGIDMHRAAIGLPPVGTKVPPLSGNEAVSSRGNDIEDDNHLAPPENGHTVIKDPEARRLAELGDMYREIANVLFSAWPYMPLLVVALMVWAWINSKLERARDGRDTAVPTDPGHLVGARTDGGRGNDGLRGAGHDARTEAGGDGPASPA